MTAAAPRAIGSDNSAVHPFRVDIPEAEITELRRRILATRWPERETVTDESQGVKLKVMQDLAQVRTGLRSLRI